MEEQEKVDKDQAESELSEKDLGEVKGGISITKSTDSSSTNLYKGN